MHNILYEVLLQKVDYFVHAPSKHVTVYSYHQYTFDVCLTLRRLLPLNLISVLEVLAKLHHPQQHWENS